VSNKLRDPSALLPSAQSRRGAVSFGRTDVISPHGCALLSCRPQSARHVNIVRALRLRKLRVEELVA
jgi:hypothetical protein